MGLINQEGWYHGVITGNVFGQSSGGLPQETLEVQATEVYDQENDEYLPIDIEHAEITWYGVLIDYSKKETKNSQQLKKITGWDGAAYYDVPGCLDLLSFVDMPLSFRVKENTYNENTTLQVEWVDTIDALPGGSRLQPITKEEGRALQAKYASVLASTKAPTKPASAKSTPAKSAAKPAAGKPVTKPVATKPKVTKPVAPKPPKTTVGKCSADDAYNTCYSLMRTEGSDAVTVEQLNELWLKEEAKINVDANKITEEEYYQIKETILKLVSKV